MSRNETAALELEGQFPNEVIRASAGTGKTFELSNRYLRLLASGVESNSILATTFTRKGAGEILDRIIGRLSAAALDDEAAAELSEQLQWKLTSARSADVLQTLLQNLHRLEIGTLDSFFNRFAKAFSMELGLPATWEIVEQQVIERIQDQAIERILYADNVEHLLHMMSHGEAKRRIATEIRDTVRDLYEVFTESTADAWEQIPRSKGFLDESALAALVESFPDVELPDLKSWRTAWDKLAQRLVDGEWDKIVGDGIVGKVAAGETKYQRREIPDGVHTVAKKVLDHCAALITNQLIARNMATRDLLKLFGDEYEPLKSSAGQLRFDDVTSRLSDFIESISVEGLSFRLDNQIRHLLLDEFQDTSPSQWNVMSPFAKRVTELDDATSSFFCVGDVKQAIFGWRGGAAEIFDRVEGELPNLATTAPRTKSWRSSPHVIQFVNLVFQNLDRFAPDPKKYQKVAQSVHAWQDWFQEHETARTDLDGCATVEFADAIIGDDGKPDSNTSLFASTVAKIQQLNEDLPESKSIGVLVRKNAEIGEIIFRLRQLGIPASEEGGNPLTDSAAVEVVLAALKLADSPGDSLARFRVSHSLLGPQLGIDQQTADNRSTCEEQAIAASKNIRRQLVTLGYGPFIESLARVLSPDCTPREATRLQQLVQVAYTSESGRDNWELRPGRFVRFVRDEYRAVEPSSARIRVMTVHKSKGLEFDAVVVPLRSGRHDQLVGRPPKVITGRPSPTEPIDVVTRHVSKETQALLPKSVQKHFLHHDDQVIREAMCLLYVALTRGVHATHVILGPDTKLRSATAASVVLSTVADKDREKDDSLLVHESGNLNWHEKYSNATAENSTASTEQDDYSSFYLPADASLSEHSIAREMRSGRGVANRFPSASDKFSGRTFGDRLRPQQNQRETTTGSLLHACFEQIDWLDQSTPPTDQALTDRLRMINPDLDLVQAAIETFRTATEGPNIKQLLTHDQQLDQQEASELAVLNEYRFSVATESGLLSGSIDRLILSYVGDQLVNARIIDFKSDNVTTESATARSESYQAQMDAYAEAVTSIFKLSAQQISRSVVFTKIDLVLELANESTNAGQAEKPSPKSPDSHSNKPTDRQSNQKTLW